jgi:phosphoribosylformimino-5-aminoimidazole carboxamide ribotide isomerase
VDGIPADHRRQGDGGREAGLYRQQNTRVRIIGVIDLKDGRAVHARGGRRETYAPVGRAAGVAVAGNALTLARVYHETFGVNAIYVADLDAIAGGAAHDHIVRDIGGFGTSLLLDAGVRHAEDAHRISAAGGGTIVVGLETLHSFDALSSICRGPDPVAFSLDLRHGVPLSAGGACCGESAEEMASRAEKAGVSAIIVLDVARVGSSEGPDVQMVHRVRRVVEGTPVLAGGGVRDLADLQALARTGCAGALVASALHDGRLTPADVAIARSL